MITLDECRPIHQDAESVEGFAMTETIQNLASNLRAHAERLASTDDPDTSTALRWAADELDRLRASHARLLALVRAMLTNEPDDMAADGVTVLDVWRKEARAAIAVAAKVM